MNIKILKRVSEIVYKYENNNLNIQPSTTPSVITRTN